VSWLLNRAVLAIFLTLVGAGIGAIVGNLVDARQLGPAVGAAAAVALCVLVDGLRALHLMDWLRGDLEREAPRDRGFWGEASYRIERALRQRDRGLALERDRFAQFMSAIEASPNGVLLLDAADQIQWLNAMAAAHFGLDPVRDRLQRVTNLVRSPTFVAYLQAGVFDEPVVFSTPGGDSTLSVIVSRYGDGMRLVLTQDITERERTEAMRRDFVANVSHEIRTPLTVLAGFVETIASLPLTEVERERVLALMMQQTSRMTTLVEDLLTLAKLEGSPRPTCDRWTPVARLFAQVESEARGLSAGRHTLRFDVQGEDELAGNDSEWTSAVANLVSNAVRYTPSGGAITVTWAHRVDGNAEIEVRDTGPGIAREHVGRLTERFYRVDGSRSRDTGGTGLGLSIVKHVVQRHGGELDIQSEPGRGSVFRIVVPAARVRPLAPTQPAAVEPSTVR
jgi:two-component system, OmpR family, phosphate regulon sensor histidine kinase PhoR